jgi:hypothetical protein
MRCTPSKATFPLMPPRPDRGGAIFQAEISFNVCHDPRSRRDTPCFLLVHHGEPWGRPETIGWLTP